MAFGAMIGSEAAAWRKLGGSRGLNLGRHFDDRTGRASERAMIYGADRHALILGPTGCGKTSRILQNQLLGDSLNDYSVIVTDPKGELAAVSAMHRHRAGHNVKVLDPFGKLAEIAYSDKKGSYSYLITHGLIESAGFNPLQFLDPNSPNFYDDAASIGEALIKVDDKDSHWSESAQGLLVGLVMWEKIRNGDKANLRNVRTMLTEIERVDTVEDLAGKKTTMPLSGIRFHAMEAVASGGEIVASLTARYTLETKEIASIRSTADTQTRWMLSPPVHQDLSKRGIDFSALKTAKAPTTCYVILPAERIRTHSVWLRLLVVSALRALYRPGDHKVMLLVDEMPALGYLPSLADAFALVRGYGVQITGIAQDLNQLKHLYKDNWESFVANAGVILAFCPNDMTTADWMSRRAGQTTMIGATTSEQTALVNATQGQFSEGENQFSRALYLPHELFGFPDGTGLLFFAGMSDSVRFFAPYYTDVGLCAERALPNPFRRV